MPKRRAKPRYLEQRRNRDGTVRYYWCCKDRPAERLSDDPEQAWQEAEIRNRRRDAERIGLGGRPRHRQGTIAWLAGEYRSSPDFTGLQPRTRRGYDQVLTWLTDRFGDLSPSALTPEFIQKLKRSGERTPFQTNARIRTIRLVWNWGRRNGHLRGTNPATAFKQLRTESRDAVWTPDELKGFLETARPSMKLALLLGVFTLQREGDLIALPWTAYDGLRIQLRQSKTRKMVSARVHRELKAALDLTPRTAVTVLVSEATGRPFDEHHFRHVFARDRAKAGLRPELQFRVLRRTGAVILGRRGEKIPHIAALGGWAISRTARILETYLPIDSEMADAAVAALEESNVLELFSNAAPVSP